MFSRFTDPTYMYSEGSDIISEWGHCISAKINDF